jgi:hypothetical protein
VIQGDGDPPLPERFPARAGQAFPLAHVLADVSELRGWEVLSCEARRPLEVAGLAARSPEGETTLLIANLTSRPIRVEVEGVAGEGRVRRLNEDTAESAMFEPERFRSARAPAEPVGELDLAPYETVRIDIRS